MEKVGLMNIRLPSFNELTKTFPSGVNESVPRNIPEQRSESEFQPTTEAAIDRGINISNVPTSRNTAGFNPPQFTAVPDLVLHGNPTRPQLHQHQLPLQFSTQPNSLRTPIYVPSPPHQTVFIPLGQHDPSLRENPHGRFASIQYAPAEQYAQRTQQTILESHPLPQHEHQYSPSDTEMYFSRGNFRFPPERSEFPQPGQPQSIVGNFSNVLVAQEHPDRHIHRESQHHIPVHHQDLQYSQYHSSPQNEQNPGQSFYEPNPVNPSHGYSGSQSMFPPSSLPQSENQISFTRQQTRRKNRSSQMLHNRQPRIINDAAQSRTATPSPKTLTHSDQVKGLPILFSRLENYLDNFRVINQFKEEYLLGSEEHEKKRREGMHQLNDINELSESLMKLKSIIDTWKSTPIIETQMIAMDPEVEKHPPFSQETAPQSPVLVVQSTTSDIPSRKRSTRLLEEERNETHTNPSKRIQLHRPSKSEPLITGETAFLKVDPPRPIIVTEAENAPEFDPRGTLQEDLGVTSKTKCMQCGSMNTPEWRKGPTGAKTLCNACGLFHSKLVKQKGVDGAAEIMKIRRETGKGNDRRING
ncbi:hypothetical protein CANARDRAFT_30009 [[Candida] arabinofermentans NRRL YB-2248]|uniref:GATA-type domain-containing protein n=1 Tax=[Candida] arabinofermentans NRRL YB-2248 TaxID=983967 RepID=A0A1E4SV55_9ASCO|nr:hypothetical protein CANARDRAFT_30009 [[Candida] arabinofermentans NRRL YB-2248]